MSSQNFEDIKTWFERYVNQFHSDDPAFQQNIELKQKHSYKVWENAADLGRHVPLSNNDMLNGRMTDLGNLRTLNDFKLLQIGWVYDLNFNRSYQLLKERGYLDKIFDSLPQTDDIYKIRELIGGFLEGVTN